MDGQSTSITASQPICSFCSEHRHPLCPDRNSAAPPRRCGCDCLFKDDNRRWSPGTMFSPSGQHEVWTEYVTIDGRKAELLHDLPPDAIAYYRKRIAEHDAAKRNESGEVR
jgi:hypothetical protein